MPFTPNAFGLGLPGPGPLVLFNEPKDQLPVEILIASPNYGDIELWDEEDYVFYWNDQSFDPIPTFFPPTAAVPITTWAAQPHYGDWQDILDYQQTEDYQTHTPVEVIFPRTTRLNTAEGGTAGVDVTTGNSGGASGDAWDTVNGVAGTPVYVAYPMVTRAIRLPTGLTTDASVEWNIPNPYGLVSGMLNVTFLMRGFASGSQIGVDCFNRSGVQIMRFQIKADGGIRLSDFGSNFVELAPNTQAPDNMTRYEL